MMKKPTSFICWFAVATVGCSPPAPGLDDDEDTLSTADSGNIDSESGGTWARFDSVLGHFGDIQVNFALEPEDDQARDITLLAKGACADDWTAAVTSGPSSSLAPGEHELTWHSWDQQAGCEGQVQLRLESSRGEIALSQAFALENTGDHSGFFVSEQQEQGIDESERKAFDRAVGALLEHQSVDFVATRAGDLYEVHAERGMVVFERRQTHEGYSYEIVELEGQNPIGDQRLDLASTQQSLFAAGNNPKGASLPLLGYAKTDERLSFIEPEDDAYPFAYERIAAYFDHPDSADFYINIKGYAHYELGHVGQHGSLNAAQSTSPLVFFGAGISPGKYELPVRAVDIAPTVARVLGMPYIQGIDERGIWSARVHLERQDGHVLEEILDGETAQRVLIVVSDGLTQSLALEALTTQPKRFKTLARLWDEGAVLSLGSISNWPSVTYPAHNVIGSGMWSGHHGLVDNTYYLRDRKKRVDPIGELFNVEKYFNPVQEYGESLHTAVHRVFGTWNQGELGGAYTASFYDPSVKDADTSDLEGRDRSGKVPFPPVGIPWPSEIPGPDLTLASAVVTGEQLVEQTCLVQLWHLFTNKVSPDPTYVILNLMATDGAGHVWGPHGDKMPKVLERTDELVGIVLQWLDKWGLLETTTIVFTSDHGMQMGDPTRSGDPTAVLDKIGLNRIQDTSFGIYLK
jgi:hypothetical protein